MCSTKMKTATSNSAVIKRNYQFQWFRWSFFGGEILKYALTISRVKYKYPIFLNNGANMIFSVEYGRWRLCMCVCVSCIIDAQWLIVDRVPDIKVHGSSEADRTQVGTMLAPWTLLSGEKLACCGNTQWTISLYFIRIHWHQYYAVNLPGPYVDKPATPNGHYHIFGRFLSPADFSYRA